LSKSKKTRIETPVALDLYRLPAAGLNPRKQGLKLVFPFVATSWASGLNPVKQGLKPRCVVCNGVVELCPCPRKQGLRRMMFNQSPAEDVESPNPIKQGL